MGLRLLPSPDRPFACTWCGERWETRAGLAEHHLTDPRCRSNATVSSPLQSRYGPADDINVMPGEATLNRVRQTGCTHAVRNPLYDDAGRGIGYQCGYCYGLLVWDGPSDRE